MIDLRAFDVLTFDCYGTLIDWERGILAALAPIFAAHRVPFEPDRALPVFAELEAALEAGPYIEYRAVLAGVLQGMSERLAFTPTPAQLDAFANSVREWPAFPDSADALRRLKTRYRLGVISNVDDDLFAHSARRLGSPFEWVVTAQQVGSYKPALANFERAFEVIGVAPSGILHVAQSHYHDLAPAKALGLATVWVNRRQGKRGFGATPPAKAEPDLEVPDLKTLAERAGT